MADNPLFQSRPDPQAGDSAAQPVNPVSPDTNLAANIIRRKLTTIYSEEPNATKELKEAEVIRPRSKHQQFIHELNASGKSLAVIQTAWHEYYISLPDEEKHQVWQEFYDSNQNSPYQQYVKQQPEPPAKPTKPVVSEHQQPRTTQQAPIDLRSLRDIKTLILEHIAETTQVKAKHHLKSLIFGLSTGLLVVFIFLFSFFNEIIITPLIQPSRTVGSTPLIVNASSVTASSTPEVIIPKINVEIPVNYNQTSDNENDIENALEGGVVHYPSTVLPGQNGNAAFFGHSSNNIFNPGKYKFAFVLLHELVKGDTFYLTYLGKVYVYQVIDTRIVSPNDVAILNDTEGQPATATLITCDPPGTSINRLAVTGEQISPNPSNNTTASPQATSTATVLAGNGPSLWARFWKWL
ncbi:MAG TPA: sortase [Candidatus Saccharimonadales bacterium]|nr:sortase [Candidatus Saccharimonadales bacterium]